MKALNRAAAVLSLALMSSAAPCAGGSEDPLDREARRLCLAIGELWTGAKDTAACAADEGDGGFVLPREAVRGGARDVAEAAIATRVAVGFRRWTDSILPPPASFSDGSPPAPKSWAAEALPRLAAEEAAVLARALRADVEGRAREAALAARIRYRRIAASGASAAQALRRAELRDGLAIYTAYRALERARAEAVPEEDALGAEVEDFAYALAPELRAALLRRLDLAAEGRAELYTPEISGFAIALVLDEMRPEWRAELQRGWKGLDALLVRQLRRFGD